MKGFAALLLAAGLTLAPAIHAQENAPKKEQSADPEEALAGWKWANFLVLFAVLGYLGVRFGNPYFTSQSTGIREGLDAARIRREDAERRTAEVERKLANMASEVEAIRDIALREQAARAENLQARAQAEMERLHANALRQIEMLGKSARLDLRREASRLALELAEQRLRAQMNPELQNSLTSQFVHSLETSGGHADWRA